jgi:hypothetical protein
LFEAPAELIERSEKRIGSLLARWEGVERPSRSKGERIINKMGQRPSSEKGRTKRVLFRGAREKRRSIVEQSENYTYVFRARAVPKQCISFFLLIIGF